MRKSTTPNMALRTQSGWLNRLGNGSSRWYNPLGLILMFFALLVPSIASAEIVTTTYDFKGSIDANNTEVTMGVSDTDYTNCLYFTKIGNVDNPGRFAAQGNWILTEDHKQGLYSDNSGGRRFLVNNLYANDIVTFDVVNVYGTSQTISLESTSTATANGNTFTMTTKGKLVVSITRYWSIKKITIQHDNSASYQFSPAIEIYNLKSGNLSLYDKNYPDFQLNNQNTAYLYNTNGIALNNRLAIPDGDLDNQPGVSNLSKWSMDGNGLKNTTNWVSLFLSVTNLIEGDRVRITYDWGQDGNGQWNGINFLSNYWTLDSDAFKDINNNGEPDEDEDENNIVSNELVNKEVFYTMNHDGHLDLLVHPQVRITKIEIFADHRAQIEDKPYEENGEVVGYTMFFEGTGQIKEKSYYVPGGLKVQFGNDNENELAYVTSTIEGPVSYINDNEGFKMARNGSNTIYKEVPTTGTFYRFVPDVDGIIHFTFKAQSIRYNPYSWNNGTGIYWNPSSYNVPDCEEQATSGQECPYALFEYTNTGGGNYTYNKIWNVGEFSVWRQNWNNGGNWEEQMYGSGGKASEALVTVNNDLEVKAGKIYYLYGNWNGDFASGAYCGVARLLDVTFIPDKFLVPLAKCIENGSKLESEQEIVLADVNGYSTNEISLKRKSSNINGYNAYIEGNKLKIKNITFEDGSDKAGVILLKIGSGDKDPVFALTIAYDAGYCSESWDKDVVGYTEGHTWDFSSNSLEIGNYYNNFFTIKDGKDNSINTGELTKNSNSQLYDEIEHRWDPDGSPAPEWEFKYLSQTTQGEKDPTFINKYDMDGDNADMIWETEGLWFETGSNYSCLFNEKIGSINRNDKQQLDPQRYVGILKGGKFTIPKLTKDDRVVVYMGTSDASGKGADYFKITNALDALGTKIDSEYHIGGSMFNTWMLDGKNHEDPNYQGCYHFFAEKNGDMTFELTGGTICKIYKIVIYRGNHKRTNDLERANNGPLVLVNEKGATEAKSAGFNLHYRGKGERITTPDVLVKTGNLTDDSFADGKLALNSNSTGVWFTTTVGEFGNFRLRLKDMDFSGKYVCDFGDRNVTVGYKETLAYPYTWDFTDVYVHSLSDIQAENEQYPETTNVHDSKGWDLSMWDNNGSMILCNPDVTTTVDDNYIFYHDSDKGIENHLKGNQLFANGKIIPETRGLWFYFDNNDRPYNGLLTFDSDGIHLTNSGDGTRQAWWNYKVIIPAIPKEGAVYLRVAREESVDEDDYTVGNEGNVYFLTNSYAFGSASKTVIGATNDTNSKLYPANDESGDYIMAIYNPGDVQNLTLTLNGWILKKMSVSTDLKTLDSNGWATESREHVVDPSLTAYLTGYDIETCFVKEIKYNETKPQKGGQIILTRANLLDGESGQLIRASAQNGEAGGCILHNTAGDPVSIFNGGFHLFVPDMWDYEYNDGDFTDNTRASSKTMSETSTSLLKAQVEAGYIAPTDGQYTNYVLSNKRYVQDQGDLIEYVEAFYRVSPTKNDGKGAYSNGHNAYLQLLTSKVTNQSSANGYEIVFETEQDVDGIYEVLDNNDVINGIYTIDGKKLETMPTNSGLYIINGKKVFIK